MCLDISPDGKQPLLFFYEYLYPVVPPCMCTNSTNDITPLVDRAECRWLSLSSHDFYMLNATMYKILHKR